jgi:hypothetical protein
VATAKPTPPSTAPSSSAPLAPPTIDYAARRTAEGLSKREIIRCLKRYLAREIYHLLPPVTAAGQHAQPAAHQAA